MRSVLIAAALLGTALAAPRPQDIDFTEVDAAAPPVFTAPPDNVPTDVPTVTTTTVEPLTTIDTPPAKLRRAETFEKRDGTCAPQPAGSGPVPNPDTADAFLAYQPLQVCSIWTYSRTSLSNSIQDMANDAPTPYGYSQVFVNTQGSLFASNYMGLYTLKAYDTLQCQQICDQVTGCVAFNMYSERDPTVDPNSTNCPNPPSLTNYKCTVWGAPISASQVQNFGQWRDQFHVVITGSNGKDKARTYA